MKRQHINTHTHVYIDIYNKPKQKSISNYCIYARNYTYKLGYKITQRTPRPPPYHPFYIAVSLSYSLFLYLGCMAEMLLLTKNIPTTTTKTMSQSRRMKWIEDFTQSNLHPLHISGVITLFFHLFFFQIHFFCFVHQWILQSKNTTFNFIWR